MTDQERDDAHFAREDAAWEEQAALTCALCDELVPEVKSCATCTDQGHKNAGYCSSCCAACPSCSEVFCEDHAHTKTKWCDLCRQRENGPEDVITEDHWQATQ